MDRIDETYDLSHDKFYRVPVRILNKNIQSVDWLVFLLNLPR